MRYLSIFFLAAAALMAGCATPTLQQQAEKADYGPAPANPRQVVLDYFNRTTFQPGSVKILAVGKGYKGYCYDPAFIPRGQNFGWGIVTTVSANDQGGYPVGPKSYVLFYRNGNVLNSYEVIPPQTPGNWVRPIDQLLAEAAVLQ